jgi:hypothetical protein
MFILDEKQNEMFDGLIRRGMLEGIKELVPNQFPVNAMDQFQNSLLYSASANGKKEIVEYLLSVGADVNQVNRSLATPLIVCLFRGQLEIAKILLDHGANINQKTEKNESVFEIIQMQGVFDIKNRTKKEKRDFLEYLLKFEDRIEKELCENFRKLRLEWLFEE